MKPFNSSHEALARLVARQLLVALVSLGAAMCLSGCAAGLTPVPTVDAPPAHWVSWVCALRDTVRNVAFLFAFAAGSIGMLLFAISKFGASVVPGGLVNFSQNVIQNNLTGLLALIFGPTVFGAALAAFAPFAGMIC